MSGDTAIVADIGGTNARFGLARREHGRVIVSDVQYFRAEDYESPRDAADAYLEAVSGHPKRGCFAIAAPVKDDEIGFTNSHWVLKRKEATRSLRLDAPLDVVNDFYALAAGVRHIPEDGLLTIREAEGDPKAPRVVIGPGTGLGQALIIPHGDDEFVIATEGGHTCFAPTTDEEIEVLRFITREHPRVSVERLLSGRGLINIHRALCVIAETPRISLRADEITKAALTGEYPIAVKAVDMFCAVLGTVAGDAILSSGARGGVYLGGGILPKIQDVFLKSQFIERLNAKGRMRPYVEDVPIYMIKAEDVALYGAASQVV